MRIAVVSDTHLAPDAQGFLANARAVCAWIARIGVDQVVHLGDATAHGDLDPAEHDLALATFADLSAPVLWLPGNHDVGEDRTQTASPAEPLVDAARLAAWRARFGADHWSLQTPGWQVLGLNAQVLGADDDLAAAQWDWLQAALAASSAKLGVMLHKPLFRDDLDEAGQHRRYVPNPARRRLWRALRRRDLRFIAAGHTHQLRQKRIGPIELVWAPSAAYTIPDRLQEPIGRKVVGALLLELTPEGHQFAYACPQGVVSHDLADHLALYPELKPPADGAAP